MPISDAGVLGASQDIQLQAGSTTSVNPATLLGSGTAAVLVSVSGAPAFGTQLLTTANSADVAVLPIAINGPGAQSINITTGY